MSQTPEAPLLSPEPQLLSAERLAVITARDTISRERGPPLEAQADRADLLVHITGQQAFFDARDKELCQAHEDYRQQVATELAALAQQQNAAYDASDLVTETDIEEVAARLGIELPR